MADGALLGFGSPFSRRHVLDGTTHVVIQQPLKRVLAFTGHSIDDVVNDPIVKRVVLGYYRLHKQVQRTCEVVELERAWNRRTA